MALQRAGDDDPGRAFALAERWSADLDPLVRCAAVAAVCEPRLLRDPLFARQRPRHARTRTADLTASPSGDRRSPGVRTLRQALGYGWSVVVAALPADGLAAFDLLSASDDPDVAWIVCENRKKARLKRLLADREQRSTAATTR